jgi:hypothetical protein
MAGSLEKVCAGRREILWKWSHCSWRINKIIFFGTSLVPLLLHHVQYYGQTLIGFGSIHITPQQETGKQTSLITVSTPYLRKDIITLQPSHFHHSLQL